jgi:adenine phosphoribosyltransferase
MAILAEGDAQNRSDLIYLEKLPLFNPDGTILGQISTKKPTR